MSFSSVISDLVPLEWLLYHLNVNKLGFRRTSSVLLLISYYPFNRAKEIRKRLKTEKRWIVIRPQMPVRARAQISRPGQLRRVFLIVYKAMRVKLYPNICSICPVIDNIKPFHCQTCHDYTILAIKLKDKFTSKMIYFLHFKLIFQYLIPYQLNKIHSPCMYTQNTVDEVDT